MNDWIAFLEHGVLHVNRSVDRFEHDQLMAENDDFIVVIDGLILNQKELFDQYYTDNFLQLVLNLHQSQPDDFFNMFRGPFTGLFYDKPSGQAVVFTNQTGDSAVFYYLGENLQVFSSNYIQLLDFLKEHKIPVTLDEKAAHWMLTFGYLIDDATFAKDVKRLRAGKALYLENGTWTERRYHQFHSDNLQVTEEKAIENIDRLFRQAVRRCFDKDLEYGYTKHLVDMSAGMDSRMVNCVAKTMGYSPITNISYSQTGSEEEMLSKAASKHFGNDMIFESLDDHRFIYDIEALARGNFGTYLYTGITGGARLLSKLDFTQFGAEQTGQLGDIVIGTFVHNDDLSVNPDAVRLSHRLPLKYDPNLERFENQDLYALYTRGFMGAMSSWFIRKQYTYALSPFLDVDFMAYCYGLPVAMRRDHHLYWKWVERYYPEALEVPTSRKRVPVTSFQKAMDFSQRALRKGLKIGRKTAFHLGLTSSRVRKDSSMNPYEYWYDTDPEMRAFMDTYYQEHIASLSAYPELSQEVTQQFHSPSVLEKLMALTVLAMKPISPTDPSSPATT